MKKLLLILFFIPFLIKGQIQPDKYYHALAGGTISAGTYAIGQYSKRDMNKIAPILLASTVGFGKELVDGFNSNSFSGKDLLYTIGSAIIVNVTLELTWKRKKRHHKKPIEFDNFNDLGLIKN